MRQEGEGEVDAWEMSGKEEERGAERTGRDETEWKVDKYNHDEFLKAGIDAVLSIFRISFWTSFVPRVPVVKVLVNTRKVDSWQAVTPFGVIIKHFHALCAI